MNKFPIEVVRVVQSLNFDGHEDIQAAVRTQFEETLAVYDLPREHQRKTYTSNRLERVIAEIKRRRRVVGTFPNEASAHCLIGAHLLVRRKTWQYKETR